MSRIRRGLGVVGAAALLLATGLASPPAATAAGSPVGAAAPDVQAADAGWAVPSDGVVRLRGHGYGHGHGMSQYGARGAAQKGLTHQQILAFYYPGTTLGTTSGNIWVHLTADTDGTLQVLPATGLRVRQVGSGSSYVLPTSVGSATPTSWRLRTVSGRIVLEYLAGSSWRAHAPKDVTLSGAAAFYRPGGTVTLRVGSSDRTYRGSLRYVAGATVNVLRLDDYVRGVVPREMPVSWEGAAVRTQAVAARTYAAWERADHLGRSWHTCDTTSCQVYGGVGSEHPLGDAAVKATAGQVLRWKGEPAFTQFSSSSGGWTRAGSMPYLVAKADPYDANASNPMNTWSTTLKRTTVQSAYPSIGTLQSLRVTRRDGNGDWGGRATAVLLRGSKGEVTVSGSTFRSRFGLRSDWIRFGS
ncbi:SpoIID/LytB domain protein [Nocardioides scoriae]|uniref:SpoIID/LytB domain protein n=1 Tax=Nocardioides scoriae TaxID=642780 RepID=A0A1H1Y4A2_9ACTN|nr:SpoIID/LytB domain-containing protein [Nocardioides scoriae]SDT15856.1 SpoIID/LytB domain protein [Nocardioides scoriae]